MVGYTLDEIRGLYNRNRYKRDVWDRMHDFAPALTKEELEKIVGETKAEQIEGRKKKACSMRASGAGFQEIGEVIGMSANTVSAHIYEWMRDFGYQIPDRKRGRAASPEAKQNQSESATQSGRAPQETEEKKEMFTGIRPHPAVKPTIPPMPAPLTGRTSAIPEDCTAQREREPDGNASNDGMAQSESTSEQEAAKQAEERQILYRKIEELERRNESLKEAVTSAEARYNAAAQGQMAALEEVRKLTSKLAERESAVCTPAIPEDCTAFSGENANLTARTAFSGENANLTARTAFSSENASGVGMAQSEDAPQETEEKQKEQETPTVRGLLREAMELISSGTVGDGERISIETSSLGTTVVIEIASE